MSNKEEEGGERLCQEARKQLLPELADGPLLVYEDLNPGATPSPHPPYSLLVPHPTPYTIKRRGGAGPETTLTTLSSACCAGWASAFGFWGSGFRVQNLGLRVWVYGLVVWVLGFMVEGLGFEVDGLGFRV